MAFAIADRGTSQSVPADFHEHKQQGAVLILERLRACPHFSAAASEYAIEVVNGEFRWDTDAEVPLLRGINVKVRPCAMFHLSAPLCLHQPSECVTAVCVDLLVCVVRSHAVRWWAS